MEQTLLRQYLATVYELPTTNGPLRVSMDGDAITDPTQLPEPLQKTFSILTAYNPRSMLLPRKVNEARNQVMRDMLILGCWRVDSCIGFEEEPEGTWREPSFMVHGMDRDEALAFGRVFRQNTIVVNRAGRPELTVTDPTAGDIGKVYLGNWRVRT